MNFFGYMITHEFLNELDDEDKVYAEKRREEERQNIIDPLCKCGHRTSLHGINGCNGMKGVFKKSKCDCGVKQDRPVTFADLELSSSHKEAEN